MEVTALQESMRSHRSIAALTQMSLEFADRYARREAEITDIAATLADLEASIEGAGGEIKGFIESLEAERRVLLARQEAHAAVTSSLHSAEEHARQVRHDLEAAQKRLSANEVRRTELRMKIEHLKDAIWSAYHSELEVVVGELGQFEINIDEARTQVDELRQKIEQMGPVNVEALQEFAELKERYDLQTAQQNDINEAISNLKATIAKLDVETKELFSEAFTAIQAKFSEVFTKLFEEEKRSWSARSHQCPRIRIEIIAQPRGKVPEHRAPVRR
jgi:chromosome segregation protein